MHARSLDGWVDVHPGDIIGGSYCVERVLDRRFGLSVSARHTQFDKRVVIRLLPAAGDQRQQNRLRREARLLAKLQSEHAARILDVGTHVDGSLYLVREHVGGRTLAEQLDAQGPLSVERAVLYVLQIATVVQEAHHLGVILRELTPRQVVLSEARGGDVRVKLVDLGAAKRPDGEATATLGVGISPYTAPELFRAAEADGRADVWALGCLLYEMLSARPPFEGEGAMLLDAIARRDPAAVSTIRSDVSDALDRVIAWALAKRPEDRFATPYALAHALRPHACAEGQVLVDRIGRVAHEKPKRGADEISGVTRLWSPPSNPGSGPGARPSSPGVASRRSVPPPPPSRPSAPPPSYSSAPPPPSSSLAAVSMGSYGSGGWEAMRPSVPPAAVSAASGSWAPPPASVPAAAPRARSIRPLTLGLFVVLLAAMPTLVLALMLRPEAGASDAPAAQLSESETAEPEATAAQPAEPSLVASSTTARASQPAPVAAPKPEAPKPAATPKTAVQRSAPRPAPRPVSPPPDEEPEPEEPIAESGPGTVVVVVLGGRCALSLDGASKGVQSSMTARVPAGAHTVTCAPKGKAPRSRRVRVEPGKKAVAMFKL